MNNRRKIYFISDLHFGHKSILQFQPNRAKMMGIDPNDPDALKKHDEWLINKWNSVVKKQDSIYILGDFSFRDELETKKILERLHGKKYLILGNHDRACQSLKNYFQSVDLIKTVTFKMKNQELSFLSETFRLELCHYPMLAWNGRMHGVCHLHGHTHGATDNINTKSKELRLDVGVDNSIFDHIFIEVEELYNYFKSITKDKLFTDYIEDLTKEIGVRM